jgi:hypothetical protein
MPEGKARTARNVGGGLSRLIRSSTLSRTGRDRCRRAYQYRAGQDDRCRTYGGFPLCATGRMEIVLVSGERIIVGPDGDATALARIIKTLRPSRPCRASLTEARVLIEASRRDYIGDRPHSTHRGLPPRKRSAEPQAIGCRFEESVAKVQH